MAAPKKAKKNYDTTNRPTFERVQGVYMRSIDLDRVNRLVFVGKKSRKMPSRLGMSILVRAGLLMLEQQMEKNEQQFIDIVNLSHAESLEPTE